MELHKRLRYSVEERARFLDTVVTWTLTPTPSGGTRLALEHTGFLPKNAFSAAGAREGWQHMVGQQLRSVLATGGIDRVSDDAAVIRPIGHVRSSLTSRAQAPRQGDEGAPDAWLELDEALRPGWTASRPATRSSS